MDTGIICIIDALGTKAVWANQTPNTFLDNLQSIHNSLGELKKHSDSLHSLVSEFDYITISDTIIITLKFKNKEILNEPVILLPIFARIIDGIFSGCFAKGLFMRGAISCGEFIRQGNIIIGPAVDDAASMHEKPEMIGIVLTPNTTLLADYAIDWLNVHPLDDYDYSQHLIKFDTPLKGNVKQRLYQINWPLSTLKAWKNLEPIAPISRLKSFFGARPIPSETFIKYENTIEFFEFVTKKYSTLNRTA